MRIIVWGINYSPELTGIGPFNTGMCEYLAENGHQVEMVTTFPYYPFWRKVPGDRGQFFRTDEMDGIMVHRCWHYVPAQATAVRRILHELSFGITSFVRLLFLARPDLYIIVSPPLALGPLASIMARFKRRRYIFHVQDLQPDAAVGLGMVKLGMLTRIMYRIESWAYRDAAIVSGISEGMVRAFTRKGVPKAKQLLFPNWIRLFARNAEYEPPVSERETESQAFRAKFGIPAGAFLVSYSGNLGRKQGLETLVDAAALLAVERARASPQLRMPNVGRLHPEARDSEMRSYSQPTANPVVGSPLAGAGLKVSQLEPYGNDGADHGSPPADKYAVQAEAPGAPVGVPQTTTSDLPPPTADLRSPTSDLPSPISNTRSPSSAAPAVLILIVGDGAMRRELEARVAALQLTNIRMLPLLIERDYRHLLAASDICLVTQALGTGQYFFPSKLLSVMSVGTPVLSVADAESELARAVEEGQYGVNVIPGNPPALAKALRELAENPAPLEHMRANTAWVRRFSASRVLGAFEEKLREVAEQNGRG